MSEPRRAADLRIALAGALGLTLVLTLVTRWWLLRNDLPDGHQNEFIHLYTLTEIFFRARDESLAAAWAPMWEEYYPPGIHLPASVFLAAFGRSREVATLALSSFGLLLLASTSATGARLRGPAVGLFACALLACYPSVFGNLRRYEPNIAVAAFVAAAAGLLTVRRGLRRPGTAALFGLLCAGGLLVDRLVFVVYLAAPAGLAFLAELRRDGLPTAARRWGGAALLSVALAGYYYGKFLARHLSEITTQLGGEITAAGDESGTFAFLSLRNLAYYPLSWIDCQMGPVLGVATLAGLLLYALRGRRDLEPEERRLLEAWLLAPLILFTLVAKKQPFYSIPVLAPAALMAAVGWRSLPRPGLRALVAAGILFFGAHQVLFLTVDRGLLPTPGRWAWFAGTSPFPDRWLGYEYLQAAPPHRQGLDVPRIRDLCRGREDPGRPWIALFSEGHSAYEGQLMPTLRLATDRRVVEGLLMGPQAVDEHLHLSHCFVYVSADAERAWPTAASIVETLARFGNPAPDDAALGRTVEAAHRAELLGRWTSERDEEVLVYALGPPPPGPGSSPGE